jgi:hypothetical protein
MFQPTRITEFLLLVFTALACIFGLYLAKKRSKPFGEMRPIVPMLHLDEAVGRSVEQGRPISYTHSEADLYHTGAPAIAASLSILGKIAETCAKYDAPMRIFCKAPLVFQVTQEVTREAFRRAGYPERYKSDYVYFGSYDYFAWYNSIMAYMVKFKPGASFLFGEFAGAALPISETGARIGAMQIGSNHVFFALSCDYFTIGEELYASAAYCSGDPEDLAIIGAEDLVKIVCVLIALIGVILNYARLAKPILDALAW